MHKKIFANIVIIFDIHLLIPGKSTLGKSILPDNDAHEARLPGISMPLHKLCNALCRRIVYSLGLSVKYVYGGRSNSRPQSATLIPLWRTSHIW